MKQIPFKVRSADGPFDALMTIPSSEIWTWTNGEIREIFDRAKADIVEGRVTEVTDLDDFLDKL